MKYAVESFFQRPHHLRKPKGFGRRAEWTENPWFAKVTSAMKSMFGIFTPSGGHMEEVYEFHIPSVDSKCGIIRGSSYYNTNARLIGGE